MTRTRTPTTSEIVALHVLGERPGQLAVDWAVDLLVRGYDTPALRQLAGESEPFDSYEIEKLLKRAFRDLNVIIPEEQKAAQVLLVSARIRQLLAGEASSKETMSELLQLYYAFDEPKELFDFYLLNAARAGIALGEDPIYWQDYWPEANAGNIDQIVIEKCREWLKEHGTSIELPEPEQQGKNP